MSGLIPPRSGSVTVAGILALGIGGCWLALIGVMLSVLRDASGVVYPGFKMLGAVSVIGCVSLATLVGGFGVLFRRNWARILVRCVSAPWIFFGWFFLKPLSALPGYIPSHLLTIAPLAFPPAAAIAWFALLSRKKVRTEFLPPVIVPIYVNLLDKNTPCSRPAQALAWGNGLFELLPTKDYDPKIEHWEFLPGSFVHGTQVDRDGEPCLLAVSLES